MKTIVLAFLHLVIVYQIFPQRHSEEWDLCMNIFNQLLC